VPTTISASGPPWLLRATVQLSAGPHRAGAIVTDTAGGSGGWTWGFTVTGSAPPPATATPAAATPTTRPTTVPPTATPAAATPIIDQYAPPADWLVPVGTLRLAATYHARSTDTQLRTAAMSLDGRDLVLKAGPAGAAQQFSIDTPVNAGTHLIRARAVNSSGLEGGATWSFLASEPGGEGAVNVLPLSPQPGLTLASGTSVRLAARIKTKAPLGRSSLMLDGHAINAEGGGPDANQETIFAEALKLTAGRHTLLVQGSDNTGKTRTVAWDFYVGAPAAGEDRVFYAPTGFSISGPFRRYWDSLGANALQILGYPISGLQVERLNDGKTYTVQYFERVRLEWHPENTGNEFEVLYGLLGTAFHKPDAAIAKPATTRPGEQYFAQTGHLVRGPFLQKWLSTGGLRVHGYPISEELTEVSPTDGRAYLVQYFQRARFEYHPENAGSPYDILLGMLGRQLYSRQYPER
jgi:hypothetical protein